MVPGNTNGLVKQPGVDIGQGNFAYCYQDQNLVDFKACEEMVGKANNLPDLSLWGMDEHPQFPAATAEQSQLSKDWEAVSPFQNSLDKFDLENTSLSKSEDTRSAAYRVSDQDGNAFDITLGKAGLPSTVSQDGQKLELGNGDLNDVAELMEIGAENDGTLEKHRDGIDAIRAEAKREASSQSKASPNKTEAASSQAKASPSKAHDTKTKSETSKSSDKSSGPK